MRVNFSFLHTVPFLFFFTFFFVQAKEGELLSSLGSQATNLVGKVFFVLFFCPFSNLDQNSNQFLPFFQVGEVSKSGLTNLSSLWGQQKSIRSQYEPCEDSSLNYNNFNG